MKLENNIILNSDYFWSPEEFITGDNLESLGEHIFDVGNYIIGDHGRERTSKSEQQLIDEQILEINNKQVDILYCYGHDTRRLLNNIDKIDKPFKLVTHNSDIGILEEYQKYIYDDKIVKWYGQNNYIKHNKVVSLPIAIARKKYPHGDVNSLSLASRNTCKSQLYYKNFDASTNFTDRALCDNITTNNGIIMNERCSQSEYIKNISQSIFVISPPGNGIDCHRIWECLYLRTIPVVVYHSVFEQFRDLPILFVENWDAVTPGLLDSKKHMIHMFNTKLKKLEFRYWQNLIKNK